MHALTQAVDPLVLTGLPFTMTLHALYVGTALPRG